MQEVEHQVPPIAITQAVEDVAMVPSSRGAMPLGRAISARSKLASAVAGELLSRAMTAASDEYFERVIDASGLASLIARAAIIRACGRAGVDPDQLDSSGLQRAMPHLEATLRLYLREEAGARLEALRDLAR
jgi:hypothetical protein